VSPLGELHVRWTGPALVDGRLPGDDELWAQLSGGELAGYDAPAPDDDDPGNGDPGDGA
jgi:segregation and condensation protein A